jgi:hypothetical protein
VMLSRRQAVALAQHRRQPDSVVCSDKLAAAAHAVIHADLACVLPSAKAQMPEQSEEVSTAACLSCCKTRTASSLVALTLACALTKLCDILL